jgi:hypothetical protein
MVVMVMGEDDHVQRRELVERQRRRMKALWPDELRG